MKKRIGIVTGGGDCPGLNAVIRGVVKVGIGKYGWEMVGILDGFEGLLENRTIPLNSQAIRGLLTQGGTILGTTNRCDPFDCPVILPDGRVERRNYSQKAVQNFQRLALTGLVATGGDGTLAIAHKLHELGIPVVGIPKTIDNDLDATEMTFGFMTAVETVTDAIDKLHSTAESHHRVMILEVMGRDAGWIALYAGMAGGADIILIPEIPFKLDKILEKIRTRQEAGSNFSIIVIAEGAKLGEEKTFIDRDTMTGLPRLGGVGDKLASAIRKRIDLEVRTTVLGHIQRGGGPIAFDRILATRLAVEAAELVAQDKWDMMVAYKNGDIVAVPILEAIGQRKMVKPDGQIIAHARALGIAFGD